MIDWSAGDMAKTLGIAKEKVRLISPCIGGGFGGKLFLRSDALMAANRLAVLDLPEANAIRAPGEAPGLAALEIAMDEMAEKLGMDPVKFRIANDNRVVPDNPPPSPDAKPKLPGEKPNPNPPFSQRQLVKCLEEGVERFGWAKRNAEPGQVRDGRWLIGIGVAVTLRNNQQIRGERSAR